jgi:hypothetical protein
MEEMNQKHIKLNSPKKAHLLSSLKIAFKFRILIFKLESRSLSLPAHGRSLPGPVRYQTGTETLLFFEFRAGQR